MFARILEAILAHLARGGSAPALVGTRGATTFAALARRVQAVADLLARSPPGLQLVAGHKEADCVAAMLACALAGRPFVFADRSCPDERVRMIAAVTGATQALVAGAGRVAVDGLPTVALEALPDRDLGIAAPAPVREDAILYVVFTSGSGGVPKGVPITRANWAALHAWYTPLLATALPAGAHVNHANLAFDMGMFDLWPSLSLGRPVIMLDHANNVLPRNTIRQLELIPEAPPASFASTPSLLGLLCHERRFDAERFPHLRFFVIGGEMIPRPLVRELAARFPQARLMNGYGPSEATCCTHLRVLSVEDGHGDGPMSVGPAVGATRMRILDGDGRELPTGEAGEVELAGPQVIAGYLPATHPANAACGRRGGLRTYRTGDLGRIDATGALTILGRIDRQVKWLGHRIELDEIERAAESFPPVAKSACVARRDEGRVVDLVLFVRLVPGAQATRADILAHLARSLPPAAAPRDLRIVDDLPVTSNGKLDAGALLASLDAS